MKKTNAIRILERNGVGYQLLEYTYNPDDLDVRTIAQENGLEIKEIYKTLVAKGNQSGLLVAVIPGNKKLDRKVMAQVSGNKKIGLVETSKLEELTGYIRGGCSPIGMKSSPPVYLDASARSLGAIWVNAGIRGLLVKINTSDLEKLSQAKVLEITEDYD